MSAEHDKRKAVKLTPENYSKLIQAMAQYPFKVTLASIANRAIEIGAPELLSPTKPTTKKGK